MTVIIVLILLIGFCLIATGHATNVNRAAVAMFMGATSWVLYICYGTDFVMSQHPTEYFDFLSGLVPSSTAVKMYISQNVFLKYVGRSAEIVLFLLATMTIVEVLDNNGCFDFLSKWMQTRGSKRLLWTMATITFLISANLDNLTTTTMMLVIMRRLLTNRRQRMIYGAAIVIAANCGGALTVIGDPNGLLLWNKGAITASDFSAALAVPCLIAWALPTYWLSRSLPDRIDVQRTTLPYRGDDTNLNNWQRILMFIVGIGGLWFIPTFHNITKLSPFLGALCVLSVLWVVNEIFNRKLMNVDRMYHEQKPMVLQYGVIQLMLFIIGVMLSLGALYETGVIRQFSNFVDDSVLNVWIVGAMSGFISCILDTFATCAIFNSFYTVVDIDSASLVTGAAYQEAFAVNGIYWKILAYCSAMGGNVLAIGSMSGLALMRMERVRVGWFFKNVGGVALCGWLLGLFFIWIFN